MIAIIRRGLWRLRGFLFMAPAAITLAAVCFIVFLIQQAAARDEFVYGYSFGQALTACFGLNWPLLRQGFVWQLVTYLFLHNSWVHLGLNMLVVLLFGSGLECEIGGRRFWRVFLTGGAIGGLGWLAMAALLPYVPHLPPLTHAMPLAVRHWLETDGVARTLDNGLCIGASGGVFALIGAYAALFPRRIVYLLLPFPVKMRARTLAIVLVGLDLAAAVLIQSQVAYADHIVGCLAGGLYGLRLRSLGYADEVE